MQISTLKIKPRKPQARIIELAKKEGNPIPIDRQPFEVQVPSYGTEDILKLVETNNQKVLSYIVRLINGEVVNAVRAQMNDDEQFPSDQEIDPTLFDQEAFTLEKLSEVTTKTSAFDLEFTDDQFAEFGQDFSRVLLPQFAGVAKAEVRLQNTANVLIGGFKDVRNEPEKMEKVKSTLDKFMSVAPEEIAEKYLDMYDWFSAMQEKRMKAWNRRQEKTDVFLD